jgi:hypothetical protein
MMAIELRRIATLTSSCLYLVNSGHQLVSELGPDCFVSSVGSSLANKILDTILGFNFSFKLPANRRAQGRLPCDARSETFDASIP